MAPTFSEIGWLFSQYTKLRGLDGKIHPHRVESKSANSDG